MTRFCVAGPTTGGIVSSATFISGNPSTKAEACRWIRNGIELTVIDTVTNRPIARKDGAVRVAGPQWTGVAILIDGIVVKIN